MQGETHGLDVEEKRQNGDDDIYGARIRRASDVKLGWITVLPIPGNPGIWLVLERNGCCITILDAWFRDNAHGPMQRLGP